MSTSANRQRSKADFRAIRERIGISQKALAEAVGVTVDVVKKWENPKYQPIPDDVWLYLEAALFQHQDIIDQTMDRIDAMEAKNGRPPESVTLRYYRTQSQYDAEGRDPGDYSVVNARSREIAALLDQRGCEARFVYPEEDAIPKEEYK